MANQNLNLEPLLHAVADILLEKLKPALIEAQATKPRLLTVDDAARYLGRTPKGIRCLQSRGGIPYVRVDGRIQFDVKDLDRWIEQNKVTI